MTTTDTAPDMPTDIPPPPRSPRVLRRSRAERVAAGVSGGLGEYFGVDPVLFRVLFAVSAFFGGAGILAYLVAWAAIPETGTERAPIDSMMSELRRRRVPPWAVAVGTGLLLWLVAVSWWAPGPLVPVVAVVIVLAVVFGRRELQGGAAPAPTPAAEERGTPDGPVDLTKPRPQQPAQPAGPAWLEEGRAWFAEAKEAGRLRRRRALPVKLTALIGLAATLIVLGIVDAASGIPIPVYFWVTLGVVGAAILVGVALRRTPWSLLGLLPITIAGLVAFAGSHASLHDGVGERTWTPTVRPAAEYRLAFGQGVLDLRDLPEQATPRTVRVDAAAGQIRVLTARSANVAVRANVHLGRIDVRDANGDGERNNGVAITGELPAPSAATGARVTVVIHLADGHVELVRG